MYQITLGVVVKLIVTKKKQRIITGVVNVPQRIRIGTEVVVRFVM